MKKLLLITALLQLPLAHAETININFNDWCPHYCSAAGNPSAPNNKNSGYQLDIIEHIFGQNQDRIKYHSLPWERAIKEAASSRLDALLSPSKREAPDLYFPEEEIGVIEWCFYTQQKSTWDYAGAASLKQVKLGFLQGNYFGEDVQAYIANNKSDPMLTQPISGLDWIGKNFKRLTLGRTTAVLDEQLSLDYFIQENDLSNQFRKASCLDKQKMYVAFSPENPMAKTHAAVFDRGIRELRASGELGRILAAYGLVDWK